MLVLPLSNWHDRNEFDCGDAQLNGWFTQVAKQHREKGVSSTFVVATHGGFFQKSLPSSRLNLAATSCKVGGPTRSRRMASPSAARTAMSDDTVTSWPDSSR